MKISSILITGNHHTPAIELIKQLKNDKLINWQIEYIADAHLSESHIKKTIIPQLRIKFHQLTSVKFNRHQPIKALFKLPQIIKAVKTADRLVKKIKPDIVISFGGYISVPVIISCYRQNIPAITHEQTLTLSLSTIINSFFVKKLALSFPPPTHLITKIFPSKIIITGNLLRSQIYHQNSTLFSKLKIKQKPLIYITGGSQGAVTINDNILPLLSQLTKDFTIIHQTGKINLSNIKNQTKNIKNYYITDWVDINDIGWVLKNASLIISRAGANTSQEIVQLKKKAILIPLPGSQQNEQLKNALWVKNKLPNTIIISQHQLNPKIIQNSIQKLSALPNTKFNVSKKDNLKILNLIHQLV